MLEADHLGLGVHPEPFFVGVRVLARVGVGFGAGAGVAVAGGAGRLEDGGGRVRGVEGAEPAGADVDVVEIGGAVGIGLGPFTAKGGAKAVKKGFVIC